jgi:NAD-dependent deacetylase
MPLKKHLVVLSGAGISAESGVATFRDSNGLWENHRIEDVASPEGFVRNPTLVLDFYNQRRAQLAEVQPNTGHLILKDLEQFFEVSIITQNVDDLHERAGSSTVVHLHGQLRQARSSIAQNQVIDIGYRPIKQGDTAADGSQLRPNIVWFGEAVPLIEKAADITATANILVVVGTSLQVYPAAGLVRCIGPHVPIFVIDPNLPKVNISGPVYQYPEKASTGLAKMLNFMLENGFANKQTGN